MSKNIDLCQHPFVLCVMFVLCHNQVLSAKTMVWISQRHCTAIHDQLNWTADYAKLK
ncbi:MAG TPA: hypothetical protein GXX64_04400 [Bacteroidales bacterium]|nr:hypothetical protein [Bacteroidales bacterium]